MCTEPYASFLFDIKTIDYDCNPKEGGKWTAMMSDHDLDGMGD